jgi:regulator of sigma E protease
MNARLRKSAPGKTAAMSYLIVFFVVSLLIFVHEVGHYVVARMLGIRVARFSVGIGRALCSVRHGETEYRLSLIPFGGYVLPAQDSYFAQTPGARLLFAVGGPAANIALTFVLSATFNVIVFGPSLRALLIAPLLQTGHAMALVANAIPTILTGSQAAAGPLGVVTEGGEFVGSSLILALQFGAVMSMNLAFMNLVPVPPLDGGRIVLSLLELVSTRTAKLHVPLNVAGFFAIVGFLLWTTALDLRRLLYRLLT